MTDVARATQRCDTVMADGRELLASTGILGALRSFGEVHLTGSFAMGLAIRQELDVLLLVPGDPTEELLSQIRRVLMRSLDTTSVQHSAMLSADGSETKHFLRADTYGPARSGLDSAGIWTADVAVWQAGRWHQRHGTPAPAALSDRLGADGRALVLAAKVELLEAGLRERLSTRQLCEAVLDGRLRSLEGLHALLAPEARGAP